MRGWLRWLVIVALVTSCSSPANPGPTGGGQSSGPESSSQPSAAATPTPSSEVQPVTLTYTGTITESRVGYSNPTQIGITRDLEMSWTMVYTGPILFDESHPPPPSGRFWDSVEVSGNLLQIGYDGFGDPHVQCSAQYSALPAGVAPPGLVTPTDTGDPTKVSVRVVAPAVFGLGAVATGNCEGDPDSYASPSYPASAGVTELAPHVAWDLASGGSQDFDRTLDFNDSGNPSIPDNNHLEIRSTVSLSPVDDSCQVAAAPAGELAAYRSNQHQDAVAAAEEICPMITWVNAPGGSVHPSREKAPPAPLGSRVELRADLCCGGDPTGLPVQWTIGGDVVAAYDVDDPIGSHGTIKPLPRTLTSRTVSFYWYGGSSAPVLLKIGDRQDSATLLLDRPDAAFNADETCGVGMRTSAEYGLKLPAFGLGLNRTCADSGISWTGSAIGGQHGSFAVIQLYVDDLSHNGAPCSIQGGQPGFAADNHTFYVDKVVDTGTAWTGSDSPGYELDASSGSWSRSFQANDYFMYKFGGRGGDSIWVPLRKLIWQWSATASKDLFGNWSVTAAHNPPTSIASVPWSKLPTWTWVDTNRNAFVCP